jgi:DoxX-like family
MRKVPVTPLDYFMATVWIANGFLCKALNLVPRHQEIVARILGEEHAGLFTLLIGIAETCMGVWIISGAARNLNAIVQIIVVASMNVVEFILVPDLLLWGRWNALFAFLFILLIFYNNFSGRKLIQQL